MSFKLNVEKEKLSKEAILRKTSPFQLFKYYCNGFEQPRKNFKSPLRESYSKENACISMLNGKLMFSDFGEGCCCDVFEFIGKLYGIGFFEVLRVINSDLSLGFADKNNSFVERKPRLIPKELVNNEQIENSCPTIIEIKKRDWTEADFKYWRSVGWADSDLKKAKIYPISHYRILNTTKRIDMTVCVRGKLVYSYDFWAIDGVFRRKIYFPFRKEGELKCIGNAPSSVLQGFNSFEKKLDILIITKSMKDLGIFRQLNFSCVAPNSEGQFMSDEMFQKFKDRFNHIVIWYDNDEVGINNAAKFSLQYGIPYTYFDEDGPKDPSDYFVKFGKEKTIEKIIEKLTKALK